MNVSEIVADLELKRDAINKAIYLLGFIPSKKGKKTRRGWSAAAKARLSRSMKRHWKERKAK